MHSEDFFDCLKHINERPEPFEQYTAPDLWTDEHTSERMLAYHLDGNVDIASRTTAFIDRSVQWMASQFALGPGKKIADFGCGPGLYTTRLARTGAAVTGIDFSERSVRYARDAARLEGLDIEYVLESYLEFETTDRFDLILMVMCDYCALSPVQRRQMRERFFRLLKPDGALLLDVYSLGAFAEREESTVFGANLLDAFWSANPYYGFLNTFKYESDQLVLDKYTIIERERTRTVYNWLQYFAPETLVHEFEENGFLVEGILANVAGDQFDPENQEFAIVAVKPAL